MEYILCLHLVDMTRLCMITVTSFDNDQRHVTAFRPIIEVVKVD